jgi:hypothetical protein
MKRQFCALVAAACVALLSALPVSAFAPQSAAAANAIIWLHTQQAADGTVAGSASRTEDTVIGLVANGRSITDFSSGGKSPIDSLRSHIGSEEQTAGNIGGLIMAVAAADLDPTAFAGRNLLQDLACTYNPSTGAYNQQLFNDGLALLALPAGAASSKAVAFLADRQQADGGWEFSPGYGSDTNTTAIAVLALRSAGGMSAVGKERALAYLKTQQQPSGGFAYATGSGDSDPNSDAAVIEALLALGDDPTGAGWTLAGKNAVTDLLTFQFENGGFGFFRPNSSPTAAPDALSTSQALTALASKYRPVRRTAGTMPSSCPTVATTPAPTPAARRLAGTGGQPMAELPMLPAMGGIAIVVLGWRLRRRRAG